MQKHFNEISLKIRGVFITAIIALSAAIGFLGEKELVFEFNPVQIQYAALVPLLGAVATALFYFIDRYWYHRLLGGSVAQGLQIERKYQLALPEISLTDAIGSSSPIKLKRWSTRLLAWMIVTDENYRKTGKLHSTAKIELFYKPIIYLFLILFVAMLIGGGISIDDESPLDIFLERTKQLPTK